VRNGTRLRESPFGRGHMDHRTTIVAEERVDSAVAKAVDPRTLGMLSCPSPNKTKQVKQNQSVQKPCQDQSCLATTIQPHKAFTQLAMTPLEREREKIGGRVRWALSNWEKLTQDRVILNMVTGCPIPFAQSPSPTTTFTPKFSLEETKLITQEVQAMIEKGAIIEVSPRDDQFVGHIFLREKKDGGQRPVFNLKKLNATVEYKHFKMEGLPMVKTVLQENDWMLKLDLKDAYFCVAMKAQHRKYLRFQWTGKLFEFQCLPFGLGSAPRDFTKLLKPAIAFMRRLGVRLLIYLDDILLMNQDKSQLLRDGKTMATLLEHLGFIINEKKSVPVPHRKLEFLGMMIDSETMTMSLPERKITQVTERCQKLLNSKQCTIQEMAALIGTLSSTMMAILPAPLQYRHLQMQKTKALMKSHTYSASVSITPQCKQELKWWLLHLEQVNGRAIISSHPDLVIETDASLQGWGATTGTETVRGHWTSEERKEPINALEMRAVWLALQALTKQKKYRHVHIRSDNVTTVSYINKKGGTKSERLINLTKDLWNFCLEQQMIMTAEYLPGSNNTIADALSREDPDASDWKLEPRVFHLINRRLGPCQIDLFASRTNKQLQTFISWKIDPEAAGSDALTTSWKRRLGYAFPPFCLIGRCLEKVRKEETELVIITPAWPTQHWYPQLLQLIMAPPLLLPTDRDLLKSPLGEWHPLMENGSLQLVAWKISGRESSCKAYQKTLQTWQPKLGAREPDLLTIAPGTNGVAGVINDRLILCQAL
jgi:ribonuclease HI